MTPRPMSSPTRYALLATALLLAGLAPATRAETVAFVGATVHPVSSPPMANATVLVEGSRITAVGRDVQIPESARKVDLSGLDLYPGFVHPQTDLGLVEIGSVRGTDDTTEIGQINSNLRAEVAFNADSIRLPPTVAGGVLTVHVVPDGGLFSGSSAVLSLDGWNWRDMTVAAPVGMHLRWPATRERHWRRPLEDDEAAARRRKEALDRIEETLERARTYARAREAADSGRAPKPDLDARLEALVPVVRGELPLYVHADTYAQIEGVLDWLRDWAAPRGLTKVILVAGYDVARMADRVAAAKIPVILATIDRLPLRDWEPYDAPFTAAARLNEAGVTFAIAAGGAGADSENARNLPFEAATAVAYGLPRKVALRSITLTAAEILGVDDRLGSIDAGKEATFFAVDGDPLDIRSHIERVWIAGREIDLSKDRQRRLYEKYRHRPHEATPRDKRTAPPS